MSGLLEKRVSCPYCAQTIEVLIDCSVSHQDYIEDCQVCCRPISFRVSVLSEDDVVVETFHENE